MVDTSTEAVTKMLEGVTQGPWVVERDTLFGKDDGYTVDLFEFTPYDTNERHVEDARFIAAARDLVPALLAERDAQAARADAADADVARRLEMHECAMAERDDCIEDWSKANDRIKALLAERDALKKERDEAMEGWHVIHPNITVQDAAETDAERFDRADWFWRVMDPDDSADTPAEAIHRGMIGDYCVCEIASSYTGPVRFGFTAPVLDPDSDDTEFLHFETQQKAIDAAKARAAALRAITEG